MSTLPPTTAPRRRPSTAAPVPLFISTFTSTSPVRHLRASPHFRPNCPNSTPLTRPPLVRKRCAPVATAYPNRRPPAHQTPPSAASRFSATPYRRSPYPYRLPTCIKSTHLLSAASSPPPATSSPSSFNNLRLGPFNFSISAHVILCLVPLLWASFVICAKLIYIIPIALPPATFNTLRLLVSCLFFSPILFSELRTLRRTPRTHFKHLVPGLQLGLLVFMANILQIVGLRYAPAGRSAFINQLSTILIPLAAAALHIEPLTKRVIAGALVAVSGIFLLTSPVSNGSLPINPPSAKASTTTSTSSTTTSSSGSPTNTVVRVKSEVGSSTLGDGLQLSSAAFTSAYVLRVSHFAKLLPATRFVPLSAVKVCTQTGLSIMYLVGTNAWKYYSTNHEHQAKPVHVASLGSGGMKEPSSLTRPAGKQINWNVKTDSKLWNEHPIAMAIVVNGLIVLWAGVMVSALSAWLQTKGQAGVSAGEAAVLFASQPVWASVFAFLLLNERMQASGMLGAGLIVVGAVLASLGRSDSSDDSDAEDVDEKEGRRSAVAQPANSR